MLERGDDPGGLQALDIGGADGADEVRVLADGLLDAAPAGVAHHVEDGRQALVDADGAHVTADGGGHAPHQAGVEGGAPGQRDGVGGGAPGGEAYQAFVVREGGDAEAVGGGDPGLGAGQGERAEGGVDRDGAEGPGQLAESVGQERVEVDGLLHLVLVRGHFAALVGGAAHAPTSWAVFSSSVMASISASTRAVTGAVGSFQREGAEGLSAATSAFTFLLRPPGP